MTATISTDVGTSNYIGGALREDLANFISNISRDETPFLSSIGTTKATSPRHDWQTDTLATPTGNAQNEDFEFASSNNVDATTVRLSNFTQIYGKTIHVAGSLLKSDPAGAANWFAYTMQLRGRELKRDIEFQALRYDNNTINARHVNGGTDPRSMGPIYSYVANWVRAAATSVEANNAGGTGTAITTSQGVAFNTALTDGTRVVQYTAAPTLVDLTLAHITSLMQEMYNQGGRPNAAQIPSRLKGAVSKLLIDGNGGAAQRRAEALGKMVNLAVDGVLTEFGFDLGLVPNYIMDIGGTGNDASNSILFYDMDMVKKAVLTNMTVKEDGTGRYGKGAIMFEESTLEARNPNSLGAIIGVQAA